MVSKKYAGDLEQVLATRHDNGADASPNGRAVDSERPEQRCGQTSGQAVYRWTLDGTNTGPGGTGNAVHISGYEEWTIGRNGLIEKSMGHMDEAEYQRQLDEGI